MKQMRVEETNRRDIEAKLSTMGDYVKINYLTLSLKNNIDFDTKKFILTKLASLYENKKMFYDAGRMMKAAAEINVTFKGKVDDYMKSSEYFIKGGNYDMVEGSVKSAIGNAGNDRERIEIKSRVKRDFFQQVGLLMKEGKRKQAAEAYEKILTMDLDENEKRKVMNDLLDLYDKLGKIREYYLLKKQIK